MVSEGIREAAEGEEEEGKDEEAMLLEQSHNEMADEIERREEEFLDENPEERIFKEVLIQALQCASYDQPS